MVIKIGGGISIWKQSRLHAGNTSNCGVRTEDGPVWDKTAYVGAHGPWHPRVGPRPTWPSHERHVCRWQEK
uniref:Uncharacterized protein n=1 Tax=Setaria viridis TaxID=4556 RepID=A0A4V6D7C8_SETVI|nr:hypothetical protein SEVIR_5G386900v2 [Setaria viridis]